MFREKKAWILLPLLALILLAGSGPAQEEGQVQRLLKRGLSSWKEGKPLQAMDWFGLALEKAPGVEGIRRAFEKAASLALERALQDKEKDQALRICRKALARLGDHPRFGTWMGRLLVEEGRFARAREILERTARLEGGQYALLVLARLRRREGDLEGGARTLEKALPGLPPSLRKGVSSWIRLWRLDAGIRRSKIRGRYTGGEIFLPRGLSHGTRRFLARLAGRCLSEAARVTGLPDREAVEVVFSTPAEMTQLGGPAWAGGLYKDGVVRVVFQEGKRSELAASLRHEFGHALLTSLAPGLPGWLQEGVAQVAEKKDPRRALTYLKSLPGTILPGSALESGFTWMRDPRLARAAYAESYLLVLYLFETRPGGRFALYNALSLGRESSQRILRDWMGTSLDGALLSMARRFHLRSPSPSAAPPK